MSEAVLSPDGSLTMDGRLWRAAIGAAGIREHKREGDHATPAGLLTLRRVLYRADRVRAPACAVRREPLAETDGWCDDRHSPAYNTMIRLPNEARHEHLWRDDALYDLIGVLGWNDAPVIRGHGSAIFLHIARSDLAPTEGCVALPLAELLALLQSGVTAIRALV